jgi:hypothetical protein
MVMSITKLNFEGIEYDPSNPFSKYGFLTDFDLFYV